MTSTLSLNHFRHNPFYSGFIPLCVATDPLVGTAFFIEDSPKGYMVTAKHVITLIKEKGLDTVWVKVNFKDGNAYWGFTSVKDWFYHPDDSVDVAIYTKAHIVFTTKKGGTNADLSFRAIGYDLFMDDEKMKKYEIGPGEEVFITGLFKHHYGKTRNIPIIRMGNLACLDEEKVNTKIGSNRVDIDAYLIEARSIGGLSGSPVFLRIAGTRIINGESGVIPGTFIFLLGLMHGHFDEKSGIVDSEDAVISASDSEPVHVNTGIGIVVPCSKIRETISLFESSRK